MATLTGDQLMHLVQAAKGRYDRLSPEEKAYHDHEQRRSFVRGMCPNGYDYDNWCRLVDKAIPQMRRPARPQVRD